jgi:hypothetical protein
LECVQEALGRPQPAQRGQRPWVPARAGRVV